MSGDQEQRDKLIELMRGINSPNPPGCSRFPGPLRHGSPGAGVVVQGSGSQGGVGCCGSSGLACRHRHLDSDCGSTFSHPVETSERHVKTGPR